VGCVPRDRQSRYNVESKITEISAEKQGNQRPPVDHLEILSELYGGGQERSKDYKEKVGHRQFALTVNEKTNRGKIEWVEGKKRCKQELKV